MWQDFLFSRLNNLFQCVYAPHFVYPFVLWWPFASTPWLLWIVLPRTWVCKSLCVPAFSSFGYIPRSGIAKLYGSSILFSLLCGPFYNPAKSVPGFWFLCILASTWKFLFMVFILNGCHPNGCEVTHYCDFGFHISNGVACLFICWLAIWMSSLDKCSNSSLTLISLAFVEL